MKALRIAALLALAALPGAGGGLSAETVAGGQAGLLAQALLQPDEWERSTLGWDTRVSPAVSVDSPRFDFFFQGTISYRGGSPQVRAAVDELVLTLDPLPFLQVRLGRFCAHPGTGVFFSPTSYMLRTDFEQLVTGRKDRMTLPADLVQASLFWGDAYLRLSAAPFSAPPELPGPGSPWFPDKDLPKTIWILFPPPPYPVYLADTVLKEAPIPPFDLRQVSVSAELGGTIHPLDLALLYYHGADNSPLLKAAISRPVAVQPDYIITITPAHRTIDALGLDLAVESGGFSAWADGSFVFSKSFLTTRLDDDTWETLLGSAPALELCLGASYRPPWADALLLAEYRDTFAFAGDDSFVQPLLSSALAVMLRVELLDGRLAASGTWIESLADGSRAIHLLLSFQPSWELELQLAAPLFFGRPDTELGQFRGNHLVSAGLAWRF